MKDGELVSGSIIHDEGEIPFTPGVVIPFITTSSRVLKRMICTW